MVFIPDPEVNPGQVLSHRLGGLAKVTWVTNFFILQICKNNIILVKKKFKKNFKTGFKKNKKHLKKEIGSSFFWSWFLYPWCQYFINSVICCHYLFLSIIRLIEIIKLGWLNDLILWFFFKSQVLYGMFFYI